MAAYLTNLSRPVRAGTPHQHGPFALAHALDYAISVRDAGLRRAIEEAAGRYFGGDRDCPTGYEPSGEDFVSPCLAEADLMRRVLPTAAFRFVAVKRFLPAPGAEPFASPAQPARRSGPKDPRIGHLIGPWGGIGPGPMARIAQTLDEGDLRRRVLREALASPWTAGP